MEFRISLAGDLGSGKSTVAKILKEKTGAEIISAGEIQRRQAAEMGLDIKDFNVFMEKDKSYDKKLDDMLASFNEKKGNFIFDSRMSWYFVPSAVSFYLRIDPIIAAKRVFNARRDKEAFSSVKEAYESLLERRESEIKRYKDYYGQDILDMNNYACVIDVGDLSPDEVVGKIMEFMTKVGQ